MSWTSPLTALPHLSDEAVAAFADGVLSDTARQRAQSHMAGCAECSDAVYGQRAARAALRAAGRPTLPDSLFERLRELPITAELPSFTMASALSADGQPLFAAFTAPVAELSLQTSSAPARVAGSPVVDRRPLRPPLVQQPQAQHPQAVQVQAVQVQAGQVQAGRAQAESLPAKQRQAEPLPVAQARPPLPAPRWALAGHRHTSTRVGLGATAAAVLAVGVLATTAANAGGLAPTARVVQPSVTDRSGSTSPVIRAPMQMTLLSVPSSGR